MGGSWFEAAPQGRLLTMRLTFLWARCG
jgi:hypothetical protein